MEKAILDEAIQLFENGNLNSAEEKFRSLYAKDKNNMEVNYYLGSIAFKKDNYDEAIEFLNKTIELNDQDYRPHEVLGQAYGLKAQRAGMVKGAMVIPKIRKSFEKAIELNPGALTAREGLFMFYLFVPGIAGGDEKKALQIAGEIKTMDEARGHLVMAVYHTRHEQIGQAAEEFEKAAELGKSDADIQMKTGRFNLESKNFEKAAKLFDRFIELKPDDPNGYDAKGEYFIQTNDLDSAVEMFNRALEKNPGFFPARFNRAEAFNKMNKKDEAIQDYKHIVEHHAKSPFADRAKEALSKFK